ncbi:hypothetical protein ABPG75_002881 [Micractinium tetrahymenae]
MPRRRAAVMLSITLCRSEACCNCSWSAESCPRSWPSRNQCTMRRFASVRHPLKPVTVFVISLAAAQAAATGADTVAAAAAGSVQGHRPLTGTGRHLLRVAPEPNPPYNLSNLPLHLVKLPPGFSISLYANASIPARGKASPAVVFVSTISGNQSIYALADRGGGAPVTACTLISGPLDAPNGIAYDSSTGSLFVAEMRRITRYDNVDAAALANCKPGLMAGPTQIVGPDVLPAQPDHWARFLGIGPDRRLYVTIAAPFNLGVCEDPYCAIM